MAKFQLVFGVLLMAAAHWATGQVAGAIEVTYGEDYVERPNTRGDDDFINLGYGIDPIPAKSPAIRFNDWRGFRAKVRAEKGYRRRGAPPQVTPPQPAWEQLPPGKQLNSNAGSETEAAKRPAAARPATRRALQSKQAPRTF